MSPLLQELADDTGLSERDILAVAATGPLRYKTYYIAKRSGGNREIAQPARELKLLQRSLTAILLSQQPIHPNAMAYRTGRSLRDNAVVHAGDSAILKMDFIDFFPSIVAKDWAKFCTKHSILSSDDIALSTQILFRKKKGERQLRLSIGAPSSPIMSNILMFRFDEIVSEQALRRGINYSRYADDLSFSGQRIGMLKDMTQIVADAARDREVPDLKVNEDKTTFITTKKRRAITGVTLANDGSIGVGRDKKRLLSAQVHHALLGKLDEKDILSLGGQLSFVNAVEPEFIRRLEKKYGQNIIRNIKRSRRPHR